MRLMHSFFRGAWVGIRGVFGRTIAALRGLRRGALDLFICSRGWVFEGLLNKTKGRPHPRYFAHFNSLPLPRCGRGSLWVSGSGGYRGRRRVEMMSNSGRLRCEDGYHTQARLAAF